ncbi:hypothetical protein [Streptobacillus moniliformis]|uniref:hypothetical protein n=1 Tax=Streptobacillus moniliformis TaxID=34105 RepID=UPI0007E3723E|nr:hypothetical protein [Streptobacillus moniliformis]
MINRIIKKEDIYEVMYNELYSKNENLIFKEEKKFETLLEDDKTKLKQLAKIKFKMKKFFYDIQFKKLFDLFNSDDNFAKSHTFITNTLNRLEITKATKEVSDENMFGYKSIVIHSDILENLQNRLICDKGCPLNSSKVEDKLRLKIILNNDITLNQKGEYISYILGDKIYDFNVNVVNEEKNNKVITNIKYSLDVIKHDDLIYISRIISKD